MQFTFNPFRNLSIAQKLTATVVTMLLGGGVIGSLYFYQIQRGVQTRDQRIEIRKFGEAADEISIALLYSQNALKDFAMTHTETLPKRFDDKLNEAITTASSLAKSLKEERQKQIFSKVPEELPGYQKLALQIFDAERKIGLNETLGLHGAMRTAAHTFETELTKLNAPELLVSLLTMRRHEKDYLQRETDNYLDKMLQEQERFQGLVKASKLSEATMAQVDKLRTDYHQAFLAVSGTVKERNKLMDMVNEKDRSLATLLDSIRAELKQNEHDVRTSTIVLDTRITRLFTATLLVFGGILTLSVIFLARGISRSLRQLRAGVAQVAEGDLEARVRLQTADELGQLGNAFDQMLDERVASIVRTERENAQLNQSVSLLLDATAKLSERDLTVRVPVTEDVTGNISDALNQMTEEMVSVLHAVNSLAAQLEGAAGNVRDQGGRVASVAANERQVVAQALVQLEESTRMIGAVAQLALGCNDLASNTGESTKRALQAVRNTARSMNDIRNSVSETEKSIKRLGERSQEIGNIVAIIKDISGRTHTLALNAGMQAVAAGEAGRGFSVVADEVQRLAETARESTEQIAALVQSIQAEAAETMSTMNKTIDQVVQGSELAETAAKRMRRTQTTTEELVTSVAQIAERSKEQVALIDTLRGQAIELQESTVATEQELQAQTAQTEDMFHYLENLVQSVRVFKLPNAA